MKATRIIFAAIFAGALFFSCTNEIQEEVNITPAPAVTGKVYKVSIDAVKAVDTKALAEDASGLKATWAATDTVAVCRLYDNKVYEVVGKIYPQAAGEKATRLIGEITVEGLTTDHEFFLQYPYKVTAPDGEGKRYVEDSYQYQDGSLATLAARYDYATCGVKVDAIEEDYFTTTKAEFYNRQAILKFSLKNSAGEPINVKKLVIKGGSIADHFWHDTYYPVAAADGLVIAPASATNELYVALSEINHAEKQVYSLDAYTADDVYTFTTPAVEFVNGKLHPISVKLKNYSYAALDKASAWTVIGKMADYDAYWDKELNMFTDETGKVHAAAGVSLKQGDAIKLRKDHSWGTNVGGTFSAVPGYFDAVSDGGDIAIPDDGVYDIYYDETSSRITIVPAANAGKESEIIKWSIVGLGGNWGVDLDMVNTKGNVWVAEGVTISATDEFKIRYDHGWAVSVGGTGDSPYVPAVGTPFAVGGTNIKIGVEGKYDITYDGTAGTILIVRPPVFIDGDLSDWDGIEGVSGTNHGSFKATSDANYIYLYSWRNTGGRYSQIWNNDQNSAGYIYVGFDTDGDAENGVSLWGNGPYDFIFVIYPYKGDSTSPVIPANPAGAIAPDTYSVANVLCNGAVDAEGAKIEFRIPRADLPAIPNTPITIKAWGNKDLTKVTLNCTL